MREPTTPPSDFRHEAASQAEPHTIGPGLNGASLQRSHLVFWFPLRSYRHDGLALV